MTRAETQGVWRLLGYRRGGGMFRDMDDARVKPPCYWDDAVEVVTTLRAAGHVAYFAGGCVRDLLLGLEPKDYDVATDAVPQTVRSLFRNTQAVGAAFGVILVRLGRSTIEVATFRSEGKYLDGRRPSEVRFTTAEEDAQRRDFTINGLFLDPENERVIDYVGGQADLKAGVIRAIGNAAARFEEDHLRLLRAVRFAARFGFGIEPETASAIGAHAHHLVRIMPERILDELRTMWTPPSRAVAWELLLTFKLLDVVFRFVKRQPEGRVELFERVAPGQRVPFGMALAAAVTARFWKPSDAGGEFFRKQSVAALSPAMRTALRLANDELALFEGTLLGVGMLAGDGAVLTLAQKKRFLARPTAAASRALLVAVASLGVWADRQRELEAEFASLEKTEFAPPPLVTGDDLTAAGLKPGPLFKRVLDAVYDAQLEGRIGSKEAGMGMAMAFAKK